VTTIRKKLCQNFCPYYKSSKNEELACLGIAVIERLIGKGLAVAIEPEDKDPGETTKKTLLDALCTACPFFENDCDFAAGSGHSPCGGFIVLCILLDKKAVCIDDITNII
jgi:hypothetical protein